MKLFKSQSGQGMPPAIVVMGVLAGYLAVVGVVDAAKWTGHEAKKVGHGIVHLLKKL